MLVRGVEGIRTPDEGFADPCLTTWPRRHFTACTLLLNFWEKNGNFGSTSISGNHAVFYKKLSGRWDSNPRPSPWQGDVLPLYYARILVWLSDRECRDTESNCGHRDFQSRALPTELSRPDILLLSVRDFTRWQNYCQARLIMSFRGAAGRVTLCSSRHIETKATTAKRACGKQTLT